MGFVHAFGIFKIEALVNEISKPLGILWLFTASLFLTAALFAWWHKENWSLVAIVAAFISQYLIITVWSEAKFGTLVNIIILVWATVAFAEKRFEEVFIKDVRTSSKISTFGDEIVTEKHLEPLPEIVRNYLRYVGIVGKPQVYNMKIEFEGRMRRKGQTWFDFRSEQFNFFEHPTRLFFMKAKVKGLPTTGYHRYTKDQASMNIKLFSLVTLVNKHGVELFDAETVTYFNDLCLFAPASLVDPRIQWEVLDDVSVRAVFKNNKSQITADLLFNETGQLINFISHDRTDVTDMNRYTFSTPVGEPL